MQIHIFVAVNHYNQAIRVAIRPSWEPLDTEALITDDRGGGGCTLEECPVCPAVISGNACCLNRRLPSQAVHYFIITLRSNLQGDPKKIPPHGNLNILAMPCWIITKIYRIAKEII